MTTTGWAVEAPARTDIVRTVAPAELPVSLAEAKEHLRIEAGEHSEDLFIQDLIEAATARVDGFSGILGMALISQTWKLYLDAFPDDSAAIELPLKPVTAISSITYVDSDGTTQTLATSVYQLVDGPVSCVALKYGQVWPTARGDARGIAVTFVAGYANRSSVPGDIRAAIKLMVGAWYESREVGAMPQGVRDLLSARTSRMLG